MRIERIRTGFHAHEAHTLTYARKVDYRIHMHMRRIHAFHVSMKRTHAVSREHEAHTSTSTCVRSAYKRLHMRMKRIHAVRFTCIRMKRIHTLFLMRVKRIHAVHTRTKRIHAASRAHGAHTHGFTCACTYSQHPHKKRTHSFTRFMKRIHTHGSACA